MNQYFFQQAKAIWGNNTKNSYNQFVGFYSSIHLSEKSDICIAIAARSYYRLYINGEFVSSGPARTAEGYCRVDEVHMILTGTNHVAVEILAIDKPDHYSNDCTMESGLLTLEITDSNKKVYSATGTTAWKYIELDYRRTQVELMSHSRGIVEYYDMQSDSMQWMLGKLCDFQMPIDITNPIYLIRNAPYPDYHRIDIKNLMDIGDSIEELEKDLGSIYRISRMFNEAWYKTVPEDNCYQAKIIKRKDIPFSGEINYCEDEEGLSFICGENPTCLTWGNEVSDLGFIVVDISVEKETILDLINSDTKDENGGISANTYSAHYHLTTGDYHMITWEPKLTRFVKVVVQTEGQVKIKAPYILGYTYSDKQISHFQCNDNDLNRIYDAAKRTLRLNTLDIFMDYPQRERGGWLCDSFFTAQGAWTMLSDLAVEKDFIENFMLTNPDRYWHSYFPEVYPGCKKESSDVGITNWSYWLAEELCDFYVRSGDREFIETCRPRIERFVEGVLECRGDSGLLENIPASFVDWSLSNKSFNLNPISVANNCLVVHMLERLGDLYQIEKWTQVANEMRKIINQIPMNYFSEGDGADYRDGNLIRQGCKTEGAMALELWSGFHRQDRNYIRNFVNAMGPCPKMVPDPNVGKANLFIGLMLRLDVLRQLHETETLVSELKEIYLLQLKEGSGTLFENSNEHSGCHGFNGAVGAMIMSEVLGLGQLDQLNHMLTIRPNPCGLKWATGSCGCDDGRIFMKWNADYQEHVLDVTLHLPQYWNYKVEIPFELCGWTIILNREIYQKGIKDAK